MLGLASACSKGVDGPASTGVVLGGATSNATPHDTEATTSSAATDQSASGQLDDTRGLDSTGGASQTTGTSDEPPPVCPSEPDDVPCQVCGKEACCAEYLVCIADEQCSCALDCYFVGMMEIGDCVLMCGASAPALDLVNCAATACDGICS